MIADDSSRNHNVLHLTDYDNIYYVNFEPKGSDLDKQGQYTEKITRHQKRMLKIVR